MSIAKAGEPARLHALDGVRGLAILLVISLHLRWLGCGWIGVQLFFVLSGFLITRLLLPSAADRPLGAYLKDFYARRALRILPLYFGYLLAVTVAAHLYRGFPPVDGAMPWAATFTFNFFRLTPGFAELGGGSERHVLIDHFWSLAVEEHFYLVWPLVLFVWRKHLRAVALLLIALGPLLRGAVALAWPHLPDGWVAGTAATANYLLSTSHVDAFGAGAFLATLPMGVGATPIPHAGRWLAVAVGVAVLAGAWVNGGLVDPARARIHLGFPLMMAQGWQHVWGYSVVNLLAAATVWLAMTANGWQRIFSAAWLRYLGRISFGLYVFHYPMMQLLQPLTRSASFAGDAAPLFAQAIYLAMVIGLAGLSYRFFERPFLEIKDRLPRRAIHPNVAIAR